MKKTITLFILFIFSLLNIQAQICNGFADDFESGTYLPTWQDGTGTYFRTVTTVSPAVGNYAFELASPGANSFYQGTYAIFAPTQPSYISWYMKTNTTTAANGYVVAGDGNIASDNGIIFCYFNSTSSLRFFNTAGYNHPIVADTWYHVEIKDINYIARNMDIYVDGVLILPDWAFRSPLATNFDRVHFHSLSASIATYDQIQFGYKAPVIDSAWTTSVNCYGNNNGSIDLFLSTPSNNGYVQYLWNNTDTTQDISNLAGGNYTVTITDSIGCIVTDSFMVYEPLPFNISATTTDLNCNGDSTGNIDLTVTGATPGAGYVFNWTNGSNAEDISNLAAGSYTVNILDSAGCSTSDTFNIIEPPAINMIGFTSDLNCFSDSSGSIDLTVSGGSPGYSFNWDNAATTEDLFGLAAGTYMVVVTDTMGCTQMDTLFLTEPTPISSSAVVTNDNGTSNGTIDLTATGGTPGYGFSWSNSATTEDLSGLAAGNYVVTITDNNGCTANDTIVVFSTAGMDENTTAIMNIWPNPFTDVINLHFKEISNVVTTLFIADVNGKTIAHYIINPGISNQQISLNENIPSGIYFLSLNQGEKSFVVKVVKE